MKNLNLLLEFKLAGDSRLHVKSATRIKVDGRGDLTLYDACTGTADTLNLNHLELVSIQPLIGGDLHAEYRTGLH